MIYSNLYREGLSILSQANITEAALDARLLLEYICGTDSNTLYAHPDMEVSKENASKYMEAIRTRATHVPLQHITGTCEFMGLEFEVNENVLIPRQDTEYLVEEVLKDIDGGMRLLDMCTGSGCIALSILNYRNDVQAIATDLSAKALEVARTNASKLGLEDRISFCQGDLYEALFVDKEHAEDKQPTKATSSDRKISTSKFDIIVSNPPYISTADIEGLMSEVREHDPYMALCGGEDGLDFYRRIIKGAPDYLANYGYIYLEIGYDQEESVKELLIANGFDNVDVYKDYSGNPRVAKGRYIIRL